MNLVQYKLTTGEEIIGYLVDFDVEQNRVVLKGAVNINRYIMDSNMMFTFNTYFINSFMKPDVLPLMTLNPNQIVAAIIPSEDLAKEYFKALKNISKSLKEEENEMEFDSDSDNLMNDDSDTNIISFDRYF